MKTFNTCTNCLAKHNWREIDYDNVLFVSMENAICLTLCKACVAKFLDVQKTDAVIAQYKQKIKNALKGKSTVIPNFEKENADAATWGLLF